MVKRAEFRGVELEPFAKVCAVERLSRPSVGGFSTFRTTDNELLTVREQSALDGPVAVSSALAIQLGVPIPNPRLVGLETILDDDSPGSREMALGFQLPRAEGIFDYMPRSLEQQVENADDLLGWRLLDLWIASTTPMLAMYLPTGARYEALKAAHKVTPDWDDWPTPFDLAAANARSIHRGSSASSLRRCKHMLEKVQELAGSDGVLEELVERVPGELHSELPLASILAKLRARIEGLSLAVSLFETLDRVSTSESGSGSPPELAACIPRGLA